MKTGMSEIKSVVKFGTDGWRGIIADDFTYANVRVAARAIAHYVLAHEDAARGVCIGYDTRFGSRSFAQVVAEVLAAAGIPVLLAAEITPTPALSYAVRERGAAGGVMITSSHNPARVERREVQGQLRRLGQARRSWRRLRSIWTSRCPRPRRRRTIEAVDFNPDYIAAIARFVDLEAIRSSGYKFLIDCMYGAGRGVIAGIFARAGVPFVEMRSEINPRFRASIRSRSCRISRRRSSAWSRRSATPGLITDGDADRIGAVDEHGNVVDAHKIFAILLQWLLERKGWPGDVTRAFNTTKMLDRIAAKHGRTLHEHGIGFKYVCDLMLEKEILIGGEESGGVGISRHLPERDGLLNSLLLAQVMADERQDAGRAGRGAAGGVRRAPVWPHRHAHRRPAEAVGDCARRVPSRRASTFAGMKVLRVETLDGIKFFLENPACAGKPNAAETWLLLRASGTEPLLRVYCESCSVESVNRVLDAAKKFVLEG